MNISQWYLRINGLAVCYFVSCLTSWGQSYKQDSLLNQYEGRTALYYLKPTLGLHWSYMTRQGDQGFTDADAFDLRNPRYGLIFGYHTGRVTLESGITTFPIYTGHRFVVDPTFVVGNAVKVTYWQFPLNIQYTIWRPTKRLELNALAGLAFNTEFGSSFLQPTYQRTFNKTNPDGSQTITRSTVTTIYRKSFFSSILGVAFNCQVLKQLDVNLQVNRLFSSDNIVNQTAQLQQGGNSPLYNVMTKAGADGLSVLLGISYRFKTIKNYRLRDRQAD